METETKTQQGEVATQVDDGASGGDKPKESLDDSIDIVNKKAGANISFTVNGSIEVSLANLVDCVGKLLSNSSVRRFGIAYNIYTPKDEQKLFDVIEELLLLLAEQKKKGMAIKELRLNVPNDVLKMDAAEKAIWTYSDSLVYLGIPLSEVTAHAVQYCHHIELLEVVHAHDTNSESVLKGALMDKKSLQTLYLYPSSTQPLDILTAGVHHLKHLTLWDLGALFEGQSVSAKISLQSRRWSILSSLKVLEIGRFDVVDVHDGQVKNLLEVCPQLRRFHIGGPKQRSLVVMFPIPPGVCFFGGCDLETEIGDVSIFIRELAMLCLQKRHSLTFTCRFNLASDCTPNMLNAIMKYDKDFVTSALLKNYRIFAYDTRLHAYDPSLAPPKAEIEANPLHIYDASDGSFEFKRVFRIELGSDVRLCVALDQSPAEENDHGLTRGNLEELFRSFAPRCEKFKRWIFKGASNDRYNWFY